MDLEKLVTAVEKFFLDIIGLIIPGALLLAGMWLVFEPVRLGAYTVAAPTAGAEWWAFITLAYVAGHGVATLADAVPTRFTAWLRSKMRWGKSDVVLSRDALYEQLAKDSRVIRFSKLYENRAEPSAKDVRRLRNAAMTLGPAQARDATIRFMHIAMLNAGVATAVLTIAVAYVLSQAVRHATARQLPTGGGFTVDALAVLLALLVALVFLQRYFDFYARAMRLPFDAGTTALVPVAGGERKELPAERLAQKTAVNGDSGGVGAGPTVYLAGGHRSGWQEGVVQRVPEMKYLNPRDHELEDPAAYTAWDLAAVRSCDVVFAYFERDNPSGYGLTLEVGYAAAYGKHVILVDERSAAPPDIARYLAIVRHTATVTFDGLDAGIAYLGKLRELDWRQQPRQT